LNGPRPEARFTAFSALLTNQHRLAAFWRLLAWRNTSGTNRGEAWFD